MTRRSPRTFELVVKPDSSGDYELDLCEASNGESHLVVDLSKRDLARLRPSVMAAVTGSKQPRSVLSPGRRVPIPLSEEAGVRLGLAALASKPVAKPARVEAIRIGVETMTSEEALYWYAHVTGPHHNRALRALRILLADE